MDRIPVPGVLVLKNHFMKIEVRFAREDSMKRTQGEGGLGFFSP
jgi:hypothetical protein